MAELDSPRGRPDRLRPLSPPPIVDMRPSSNLFSLVALALVGSLAACDATIGSNDEVGDSATDTGEGDTGDPMVATCSSDGDCGQGQICLGQFCSTPSVDSDCSPGALTMDGCPSNAICLADPDPEVDAQACYTMPPCAAAHTCPVGIQGALCNVDYLFDKDEICLIGVCDTIANCPADWSCVRQADNDPLGLCSGGSLGEPCSQPEHCLSGVCFTPIPGLFGFCQG